MRLTGMNERDVVRQYIFEIRRHLQIAKVCATREEGNAYIDIALAYLSLLEAPERTADKSA